MRAGLSEQDRAIVWMENSPEYVVTYLAVLQLGGIVVAVHPQTTAEEVGRIIRHVGGAGLIVSPTVKVSLSLTMWVTASTCLLPP